MNKKPNSTCLNPASIQHHISADINLCALQFHLWICL